MPIVTGIAAALAWLLTRDRRAGVTLGLVVFSHCLLDFLMHSNLPLFFNGSPLVGLGLENSGLGFLFMTVLDLVLLAAGLTYYFVNRKRTARQPKNILKPL